MTRLPISAQLVGSIVLLYGAMFVGLLAWMMNHIQVDFSKEVDKELTEFFYRLQPLYSMSEVRSDSVAIVLSESDRFMPPKRYFSMKKDERIILRSKDFPAHLDSTSWESHFDYQTIEHDGRWYRVLHVFAGSTSTEVVESISSIKHTLYESYMLVVFSIPFAIILCFVGGYIVVRRLLRPVKNIVDKARKISSENLNERIPHSGPDDELNHMVTALNEMIGRLEDSFMRMEYFSANAAHELRTPLTILKGEMEVALQQPRTNVEYQQILESNLEEIERIARTVETMFLLSKLDSQTVQVQQELIDLSSLLEDIIENARTLANEKGIEIICMSSQRIVMEADVVLLTQLMMNLLENAIKYNTPGGKVHVFTKHENDGVLIAVQDTGIGIDVEAQQKIFERFYRVDKHFSRRVGGAGLGLSIASWIAAIHGGTISVESTRGLGSTFTVFLPAKSHS